MIAEAVDVLITLGWALLAWIALLSAAVTLLGLATVAAVAVPVQAACRAVAGALAAWDAVRALELQPDRYRLRQVPYWAAA